MAKNEDLSPAIAVARDRANGSDPDEIVYLSTGIRARIIPVSASLIDQVTSMVKDTEVPMWFDEDKGRSEPNPNDPAYLAAKVAEEHQRGVAAIDAMILFGVELVDGLPEDDTWIKKLKYLGIEVDADDPFEREFAYKKYVAVSSDDLVQLGKSSGIRQEDVTRAAKSFRGAKARRTD